DSLQSLIEEVPLGGGPLRYLRVRRNLATKLSDQLTVPGIVLSRQRNILRTDGLSVEARLGQGSGVDDHAKVMQDEKLRSKQLQNSMQAALIERERLAQKIFTGRDKDTAQLFTQAYFDTSLGKQAP